MPMKRRRYLSVRGGHSKAARERRMHNTVLPSPRSAWKGRRKRRVVLHRLYLLACREQRLLDRIASFNKNPGLYGLTPADLPKLQAELADVRAHGHKAAREHHMH